MANSGIKKITKLRKYINGSPTDEVKDNVITDSDYIPNYVSTKECPIGCDAIVSGSVLINASSTGSAEFASTTTTTAATTTTTTSSPVSAVKDYGIQNNDLNNPVTLVYADEFNVTQEVIVQPNTSSSISSSTEPYRASGATSIFIESQSPLYIPTTTTTTVAPTTSDDYVIDNSNGTETVVVSLRQMGSSTATETEIKPGKIVKVSSDDTVTRVSGSTDAVITQSNTSIAPTQTEYTITNNSFYESDVIEYRPYLGVTDEIELSPGETITIKSQDPPKTSSEVAFDTFTGNGTDDTFQLATEPKNQNNIQVYIDDSFQGVEEYSISGTDLTFNTPPANNSTIEVTETKLSVTSGGNATQEADPATIETRICNQNVIYNDSESNAIFSYQNCNQEQEKISLEPHESATVSSIGEPTLITSESPNVGTNFAVETIEKEIGTSGSATPVIPKTTTTTTTTTAAPTTKAPNTQTNVVQPVVTDFPSGEPQEIKESGLGRHNASKWFPKTIKVPIDKKTGQFKFISYDSPASMTLYKVKDGSNLLLDVSILTNGYNGRYQQIMRTNLIGEGMSQTEANEYTNDDGAKRVEARKLGRVKRRLIGWKELYNPFGNKWHTEFVLNKVTSNDYVTVEVYQASYNGDSSGGNQAISYVARFEVTGIQS